MTTTEERLAALEARVAELEESAVDAELARLRSRIDDLRVQASLARMDAQDDVRTTIDRLEGLWGDARQQLEKLRDESRDAGRGVGDNLRHAVVDLRTRFEDATSALRGRTEG